MRTTGLFGLLATIFCIAQASFAVTVQRDTSGGGVIWTHNDTYISEVQLTRGSFVHGDGYDGAMNVQVSGSVGYSVDLHFSSTYAVAIEMVTVENPGSSSQTYTISCNGNLGSDGSTIWHYVSSSGPYYTISSDRSSASEDGNDPVISFLYGDSTVNDLGTQRSMSYAPGNDDHSFTLSNVTIPAGGTHRYLFLGGAGDIDDTTYNRPSAARSAVLNLIDPANWPDDFTDFLSVSELFEVVNWKLGGSLYIQPADDFVVNVYEGAPIVPSNTIYTVSNVSDQVVNWNAECSESWMSVLPAGGMLEPNEVVNVTVTIDPDDDGLPLGENSGLLTFHEPAAEYEVSRSVIVSVYPQPVAPTQPFSPNPYNGAQNISAGTQLSWSHDTGTILPSPLVNTASTYSVYFGTESTDMALVAAGLTNTVYNPGILNVDTTYYWQVVASNDIGSATGAVWNFSTWISGPLDHFDCEIISEHPRMSTPFEVAVWARDAQGHTLPQYTQSIHIDGYRMVTNDVTTLSETFEGSDVDDWSLGAGVYVTNDNLTGSACLVYSGNSSGSSILQHDDFRPDQVEFRVRSDSSSAYTYARFTDSSYNTLAYVTVNGANMYLNAGGMSSSVPIETNRWYGIELSIDWEDQRIDWYRDGEWISSSTGFYTPDIDNIGRITLYSSSGTQARYDDFKYVNTVVEPSPLAIVLDSTPALVSGGWTGQVTVAEYVGEAFLRAYDNLGRTGDSDHFEVDYLGDVTALFPDMVTEGDGTVSGSARLVVTDPSPTNLLVSLSLNASAEIEVPATVEIPAGQTSAFFDFTVLDDALLDGTRTSLVSVACSDYRGITATAPVHDNETAVLSLSLPQTTQEGVGSLEGMLSLSRVPDMDVIATLVSDDEGEVRGKQVIIPAGQTFTSVSLEVVDDDIMDGAQLAHITAQVRNWTGSQVSVFVMDNETTAMSLEIVPSSILEGSGTLTEQAYVRLSGKATHDVTVLLQSSEATDISVPESVTVAAGQSRAYFDLTVHDNNQTEGARELSLTAQSSGYVPAADHVSIQDDDLHHLTVDGIPANQALYYSARVNVSGWTIDNRQLTDLPGPILLSANGDQGSVVLSPSIISSPVEGIGSEIIQFRSVGRDIVLVAETDSGITGTSTVFNVVSPVLSLSPDNLTNTLVVAGETAIRSMVISNAGNADLEIEWPDLSGSQLDDGLIAYYPFNNNANDESGNGHDGAVNGAVLAADRFGNANSAYYFDGYNDQITLPQNGPLNFERTDAFSESFWFNSSSYSGSVGKNMIAKMITGAPASGVNTSLIYGHIRFLLISNSSTGDRLDIDGTTIVNDGQWHHVVITYDGSSDISGIKVYIDGEVETYSVTANSLTGSILNDVPQTLGARNGYAYYDGYLDDLRFYTRNLSEAEVEMLYTDLGASGGSGSGATAIPSSVYYAFDGDATDSSGNGADGIVEGATLTEDRDSNANSAYAFDEGAYIRTTASSGALDITGQISMSGWINPSQFATKSGGTGTMRTIMRKLTSLSFFGYAFSVTEQGQLAFDSGLSISPNTHVAASGMDPLPTNTWSLVAITYDGAQVRFYVNGELADTQAYAQSLQSGTAAALCIGRHSYESSSDYFYGAMDDLRLYDYVLSAEKVRSLLPGAEQPDGSWLSANTFTGTLPPGGSQSVEFTFDATEMIPGDFVSRSVTLVSNESVPTNLVPVSMLVLPPAPVMAGEPDTLGGTSVSVSWSAVDGPVQYQAEVAPSTNSVAIQQSDWIASTNYTFDGLSTNATYYFRARASVTHASAVYAGPWSGWIGLIRESALSDSDSDGMPDAWEELYFGEPDAADSFSDSDGDGMSDCAEFIAGMNPTNAASCFALQDVSVAANGQFVIHWDSVTGRVYSVYWKSSLSDAFSPMATNIFYPQNSYTDTVHQAESIGYYMLGVEKE